MNIVYTGGGTLGSVTPLLALAEKEEAVKKIWIGTEHGPEREFIKDAGLDYYGIPEYKLRRYVSLRTLTEIPRFFEAYKRAKQILKEQNISFVYTAGGFTGVPVCFAAQSLKIPYAVIQLDYTIGLANKLIQKKAFFVFTSLEKHLKNFSNNNQYWTGIPSSENFLPYKGKKDSILILGGGTGSKWLNDFCFANSTSLLKLGNINHIYGSDERIGHPAPTDNKYKTFKEVSRNKIAELMKNARIIISRAGMGTLSEISSIGVPSVIIPMPNSHQINNAKYFAQNNCIIYIDQSEPQKDIIKQIEDLYNNSEKQQLLVKNLHSVLPEEATEKIISITHLQK